jgi:tRNA pseudouridine13 synthase
MTIRKTPADFVVEELLTPEVRASWVPAWSAANPIAILQVRKESLTTPEAAGMVCRALHLKTGTIEYAGLKDKHAITTQHMSVVLDATRATSFPGDVEGPRWKAKVLGFSASHLRADAIACNRFSIVVRDLSRQGVGLMNDRATTLRTPSAVSGADSASTSLRLINYFGDQRFGSARHGQGFAARHLVKGEFEAALKLLIATPARKDSGARRDFTRAAIAHWGDWQKLLTTLPKMPERAAIESLAAGASMKQAFAALPNLLQTLAVEAYQSHLWNATARRMVESECARATCKPILAEDDFGTLGFMPARHLPPDWESVSVPLPSPDVGVRPASAVAMDDAMREEGLRLDQLVIPGLRRPVFGTADRPLLVNADDFSMSSAEKDELASERSPKHLKRRIEFTLPRGAYATVVLRALGE